MTRATALLSRLLPDLGEIPVTERLRASLGAMLGLLLTGLVSRVALGRTEGVPLLIAPMGASAVLLFAVPSSPLAQPWSILGGNIVSALIGVTAARLIADPIEAAAVAGALAIGAMMMLRCLHPPSGAVALTAVLGGPALRAMGFGFVIWPVGLNSVLLLGVALAFNNVTGRRYPHRPARAAVRGDSMLDLVVSRVLKRRGEIVDIGPHDLGEILEAVETEFGRASRCADLMRPETLALEASATVESALDRMEASRRTMLPVLDADGRFAGLARQVDLVRHQRPTRRLRRMASLFRRSLRFDLGTPSIAASVRPATCLAGPKTPLTDLLDVMLASDDDYAAILDAEGRLVGAVTQGDLLHWLAWQGRRSLLPAGQPSSVIQRL